MAARSSWKGFLKISLVSLPVKAYTATTSGGNEIHLNQLHAECNSRINSKKTCPIHGEVTQNQIVSGYEHAKGQYVVIDTDELDKLRTEDDKAINIREFIAPADLDMMYSNGRSYYLVPDGPVAQRPYAVLHDAMVELQRYAVANIVLSGKEQVVLLRPINNLLSMTVLSYDNQITKPSTFEDEVVRPTVEAAEMKLMKTLIDAATPKTFDFAKYKDIYTEKLTKLIEAKVAGEEIVAPPVQEHAHIINLMDALKQSVAQFKQAPAAGAAKPAKKMAASVRKAEPGAKKRKTG